MTKPNHSKFMYRFFLCVILCFMTASAWGQQQTHLFQGVDAHKIPGHGQVEGQPDVLETGEEILSWSLDDVQPGLYVATMEVRTGSAGPLNMIPHYQAAVSDKLDQPESLTDATRFHRLGDNEPKRTSTEYPVFVGFIESDHPIVVTKRSRQIQVTCRDAAWGRLHKLELKPAEPSERITARLVFEQPFHLFRFGEPIFAEIEIQSYLDTPTKLKGSVTLISPRGEADRQPVETTIEPGQTLSLPIRLSSAQRGCHFADLELNWGTYQVSDHAAVGVVAVPLAENLSEKSMFGFHPGELTDLYQSGFKWVRLWDSGDVWAAHEREGKGQFDFAVTERKVKQLRDDGFKVLAVLGYSPTWASTHPEVDYYVGKGAPFPPRDIEDWEDYCREYMTRFKGRITHFEVWNEPNTSENHGEAAAAGFFRGTTDQYVQLLEATYRVAREVDPKIKVVGGSGTGEFLDWCEKILSRGAAKHMDILSFHSYTTPGLARGSEPARKIGDIGWLAEKVRWPKVGTLEHRSRVLDGASRTKQASGD